MYQVAGTVLAFQLEQVWKTNYYTAHLKIINIRKSNMGIIFSQQSDDTASVLDIEKLMVDHKAKKIADLKKFIDENRHNVNILNNFRDNDGIPLLINLIFEDQFDLFSEVLKIEGIDSNVQCDFQSEDEIGFNRYAMFSDKLTPVQVAVREGLVDFVNALLNTPGCDNGVIDEIENTLLHLAAQGRPYLDISPEKANHVALVRILLNLNNCSIDAVNCEGRTAEMIAKANKQFEIFEILMQKRLEGKASTYPINELPTLLSPSSNNKKNSNEEVEQKKIGASPTQN